MPPKKTISRPEVRKLSWENLRGDCSLNILERICYDPIDNDREPSQCDGIHGPAIPPADRKLKKSEFYRDWIGARIEQGRLGEIIDQTYLSGEFGKWSTWAGRCLLFILPKTTQIGKIIEGDAAAVAAAIVDAVGVAHCIVECSLRGLCGPEELSSEEVTHLLARATEEIYVQKWGQYFAVMLELKG